LYGLQATAVFHPLAVFPVTCLDFFFHRTRTVSARSTPGLRCTLASLPFFFIFEVTFTLVNRGLELFFVVFFIFFSDRSPRYADMPLLPFNPDRSAFPLLTMPLSWTRRGGPPRHFPSPLFFNPTLPYERLSQPQVPRRDLFFFPPVLPPPRLFSFCSLTSLFAYLGTPARPSPPMIGQNSIDYNMAPASPVPPSRADVI